MICSGNAPLSILCPLAVPLPKRLEALQHHLSLEHAAIMETNNPKNESQKGNPIFGCRLGGVWAGILILKENAAPKGRGI